MSRFLALLATLALGSVALAGGADFLVQIAYLVTGWHLIRVLAAPFAIVAVVLVQLAMLASVVTPRVPLRVSLPLWFAHLYLLLGAMPFGVLLYVYPAAGLVPPLMLVGAAALAGTLARRLPHAPTLGVSAAGMAERPAFAPVRTLALLAFLLLALPVGMAAYLAGSAAWTLSFATASYAGLTSEGFVVRGRSYEREGNTVVLQGMMHIGEGRAYEDLYAGFNLGGRTVVLTEGVSDEDDLLGRNGIGYSRVAERLGLEQQHAIESQDFEVRNADVDVKEFEEGTLELLRLSFAVWAADDPLTAWVEQSAYVGRQDPNALYATLYKDIVVGRNEHLLGEIEASRSEFDHIVVPWGAAHMPGLTNELEAKGYVAGEWTEQVLWSWSAVAGALR